MTDTPRINLTADEAREFHETGRVELWTEIEPQLKSNEWMFREITRCRESHFKHISGQGHKVVEFPFGPDGERWIAEPWFDLRCACDRSRYVVYDVREVKIYGIKSLYEANTMKREDSRANANITTTAEQRDSVWGFVTVVEVE